MNGQQKLPAPRPRTPQSRLPRRSPLACFWTDDRGSVLAFSAIAILGILGMLALSIDLGMLYEARGEAQRTADAAALAGAGALVDFGNDPGVEVRVFEYASIYAAANLVRGQVASMEPADVVVDLAAWTVTATVHRTAARANPVATVFGRIIGFNTIDVNAIATAQATEAGWVNCLLPLALPDRWFDANADGLYDTGDGDFYIPWPEAGATGYGYNDVGTELIIKPFKGSKLNESWWYAWRPPGQQGGADFRANIAGCTDPDLILGFGDTVDTEPGAMLGPAKQGFNDLIEQDPGAVWDAGLKCVTHGGGICGYSPRIRPMPMFDPRFAPDPGKKPFTFTNFANVFVDRIQANDVYVVLMGLAGVAAGGAGGGGAAVRIVRLVR